LVIMDAGGGPTLGDRAAHVWDLSTTAPTLTETVSVQGAGFSLVQPLSGDTLAITVTAAQVEPGRGADFRSGVVALPTGPDPRLRLEVVFGPTVVVTADDISRWFSSLTIPPASFDVAGLGTVRVVVSSVAGTLAQSMIHVRVAGTVAAPAVTAQAPFTAGAGLGVVPSRSPIDPQPAEVTIVGRPTVELAPPLAVFAGLLNLALSTGIFSSFLAQVGPILDSGLRAVVARAFSLLQLPSATLSIREIAIEPSAITFQPALGLVGTGLSTFQPDPRLLVPTSTSDQQ
jgi:hypothetical protein